VLGVNYAAVDIRFFNEVPKDLCCAAKAVHQHGVYFYYIINAE
jgi:hypothetical protein